MKKKRLKQIRAYAKAAGLELEPWQVAMLARQVEEKIGRGMAMTLVEIRSLPETRKAA